MEEKQYKMAALGATEEELEGPLGVALQVAQQDGKGPSAPMAPVDVPSEADLKALIKTAANPRDEAIIRLMVSTGMCLSECAGIKTADLELGAMPRIRITSKGGRVRYMPITPQTALVLRRSLHQRVTHAFAGAPGLCSVRATRSVPRGCTARSGAPRTGPPGHWRANGARAVLRECWQVSPSASAPPAIGPALAVAGVMRVSVSPCTGLRFHPYSSRQLGWRADQD